MATACASRTSIHTHPVAFRPFRRTSVPPLSTRMYALRTRRVSVTNSDEETMTCTVSVDRDSEVFSVALPKPLGIVLQADKDGNIVIDQVVPGGNASRSSTALRPGDRIKAVTARNLAEKARRVELILGDGRSKTGIFGEAVIVSTEGQSFDLVMAAISSNRPSFDVHLVVERLSDRPDVQPEA